MGSFVAAKLARRKVTVADHILTQTYPLVKDPKLLLAVLQNLFEANDAGIQAMLLHEELQRKMAPVADDFESRLIAFQQQITKQHRVPKEFLRFVGELRETMHEHQMSPIEFARKGNFVICDEGYKIRTLTATQLQKYVQKTKAFVAFVEEKVNAQ
jgi:hypothetical protein